MKWKDMQAQIQYGGAIGAAKDLYPEGRQDILERLRPQIQTPRICGSQPPATLGENAGQI